MSVEAVPANPTASRALQQRLFSLLQITIHGLTQKSYILVRILSFYVASGYLNHARKVFENVENPSTTGVEPDDQRPTRQKRCTWRRVIGLKGKSDRI
ncbi:hypothetical protein EV1_015479 [Malus domestica]